MKMTTRWKFPLSRIDPAFVFSFAFFLCGAVVGLLVTTRISGDGAESLMQTLTQYVESLRSSAGAPSSVGQSFLNAFEYHTVVFLAGFTSLGVVVVPVAMAVRGFFLSFSITSFVLVFGWPGLGLALGAFLVQTLILLPCLFILANQSFTSSVLLLRISTGKMPRPPGRLFRPVYYLRFGVMALVMTMVALYEAFLSPLLLSWLVQLFSL